MPASIAYHTGCQQRPFRVAVSQLSLRAVTTLPTKPAVGTQLVFSDPRDRSTWEIALIVVLMTPTNHPGAHWAIGVVGDGDTRGQRHPEWGSTLNPRFRVESAWGAVSGLLPTRFPKPLAEPAVRVSTQRALHGNCRQAG